MDIPEIQLGGFAGGDPRIATWEWIVATDELRWTSAQTEIYSQPVSEINSSSAWASLVNPEDIGRLREAVESALRAGTWFSERFRVAGRDGVVRWVFGHGRVFNDSNVGTKLVGLNFDVTDFVEAQIASENRFNATFDQAAMGIAHVAPDGTWLNVNRRCLEILGYSKDELLQLTFGDLTHPDDLESDWALVKELLNGERSSYSMEKRYIRKSKEIVWANLTVSLVRTPIGAPHYFISMIEDITLRRRVEQERDDLISQLENRVRERTAELEKLSLLDPLTGIANRRCFDQCLEAEWNRAVRTHQPLSLILIDIDFFKQMNDSRGHSAADDAIRQLAGCLSEVAKRSADLAARYGGDEFVLVLPDTHAEGALRIAKEVQALVDKLRVEHPRSPLVNRMTVSQGIAVAVPNRKGTCNGLILDADRALYRAKQSGRNRMVLWDSASDLKSRKELELR
jgi:diguanylate cyclase (GGDEF)-like protein/PAS domain S-box-containing protein